jgi:hypothetical protein
MRVERFMRIKDGLKPMSNIKVVPFNSDGFKQKKTYKDAYHGAL